MSSKQEKNYMNRVAQLGCIIPNCGKPAEIHHIRRFGEKRKNSKVCPLCYEHHRGSNGIHHIGKKAFEREFMTQDELLEETERRLQSG